ncbi:hypothetical protein L9F63_007712, partial [Diploptera punctata]
GLQSGSGSANVKIKRIWLRFLRQESDQYKYGLAFERVITVSTKTCYDKCKDACPYAD